MAVNVPSDSLVRLGQSLSLISQVKHGERQNYNHNFWQMKFRGFSPLEGSDPNQDLRRICELRYQWLRPDVNSKEEILDQLLLEQIVICMPPELQALVKESRVKSCKDLEKMLKDRKHHNWYKIYTQGQAYLLWDSSVEKTEAPEDKWDHMDLSQEHLSNRSKASPELQNLSETEEPSTRQSKECHAAPRRRCCGCCTIVHPYSGKTFSLEQGSSESSWFQLTHFLRSGLLYGLEAANSELASPQSVEQVNILAGQAQFQCTECKKRFLYGSHFDLHQRSRTGERPCKGNLRNKAFLQSSDLRVHQRVHTGEKPYMCAVCRKEFTHGSTLQGHNRLHTKEKPYVCKDCGQLFHHKGNLAVHFHVHCNLRPYSDSRGFGSMKTHLRKASM